MRAILLTDDPFAHVVGGLVNFGGKVWRVLRVAYAPNVGGVYEVEALTKAVDSAGRVW